MGFLRSREHLKKCVSQKNDQRVDKEKVKDSTTTTRNKKVIKVKRLKFVLKLGQSLGAKEFFDKFNRKSLKQLLKSYSNIFYVDINMNINMSINISVDIDLIDGNKRTSVMTL